jgi:hypothetical protein
MIRADSAPKAAMHATAAMLTLAIVLAGCALPLDAPDWLSDDAAGPEPYNYRFTLANALNTIIGGRDDPQSRILEISRPRRVNSTRGASWLVCIRWLRYASRTPRAHYAVFLQRDKIVESRLSAVLDQCEGQPYTPFTWSTDIDHPVPLR